MCLKSVYENFHRVKHLKATKKAPRQPILNGKWGVGTYVWVFVFVFVFVLKLLFECLWVGKCTYPCIHKFIRSNKLSSYKQLAVSWYQVWENKLTLVQTPNIRTQHTEKHRYTHIQYTNQKKMRGSGSESGRERKERVQEIEDENRFNMWIQARKWWNNSVNMRD